MSNSHEISSKKQESYLKPMHASFEDIHLGLHLTKKRNLVIPENVIRKLKLDNESSVWLPIRSDNALLLIEERAEKSARNKIATAIKITEEKVGKKIISTSIEITGANKKNEKIIYFKSNTSKF
jgi:hypothetical protein